MHPQYLDKEGNEMRQITDKEHSVIAPILSRLLDNIRNGENSDDNTTDESLMYRLTNDQLRILSAIVHKYKSEYEI